MPTARPHRDGEWRFEKYVRAACGSSLDDHPMG